MIKTVIFPKQDDPRLTGFNRLNETVIYSMLEGYPENQREKLLSLTPKQISVLEKQLQAQRDKLKSGSDEFFEADRLLTFWSQMNRYITTRQTYIHQLT